MEGPNENGETGEEREDVNEYVQGKGRVEIIQTRKNNQTKQNATLISGRKKKKKKKKKFH